ncbi:hypothetical protein [Bradyrhizobium sp. USDA 4354]
MDGEKPASGPNDASLCLKAEHEEKLATELRDTGKIEHADALGGAGLDPRVVGIDSLLADEDIMSVIFLPYLANCYR